MKKLIICAILGSFAFSAFPQEFMKVSGEKIITEDHRRCFQVKKGYKRKDKTEWQPFCGVIKNFYYDPGYEYTMYVEKFDTTLDTITVIKTIARDNSDTYRKQQKAREERERRKAMNGGI